MRETQEPYTYLLRSLLSIVASAAILSLAAAAQTETVLYSFAGASDGGYPGVGGLVRDSQGNLYGTTDGDHGQTAGWGTVFKLSPGGNEEILYRFTNGTDGELPSGLIRDAEGNLYGTAAGGAGQGIVFEVTSSGIEQTLYSFTGGSDGGSPNSGVIRDWKGNLYGTTFEGGVHNAGTIFQLDPANGKLTTLYSFTGGGDGGNPTAGVVRDAQGNSYGSTAYGGNSSCTYGCGVIYQLSAAGHYKVIYSFRGGANGEYPYAGVALDAAGNIYGATSVFGGDGACAQNCGTVFKIQQNGTETVLHTLVGTDGSGVNSSLLVTQHGIFASAFERGPGGSGEVFEQGTSGYFRILYGFTGGTDGGLPVGKLVSDSQGNLYGETYYGGAFGFGTVFKITP